MRARIKIALTAFCVILFCVCSISVYKYYQEHSSIDAMNREELHYDASGFLVLINTDDNLIGIYSGSYPLAHFKQHIDWNQKHRLTTIAELKIIYHISLNDTILKFMSKAAIPITTPVIIYDN